MDSRKVTVRLAQGSDFCDREHDVVIEIHNSKKVTQTISLTFREAADIQDGITRIRSTGK